MLSRSLAPGRVRPGKLSCVIRRAAVLVCAVIGLAVPSAAAAGPVVIPPSGQSYDALAVAWWKHVVAIPAASNPLRDATGAHCADEQAGPVFFLVGGVQGGDGTASRTCTVHGRKALFFPLVNAIVFHTPAGDFPDNDTTPQRVYKNQFLPATNQRGDLNASELRASVDGSTIGNLDPRTTPFRACSLPVPGCAPPTFAFRLPADNIFDFAHEPAGTYFPALQDGYYLLLAPMAPGTHTITFGGNAFFGVPFSENVTYRLTVVP